MEFITFDEFKSLDIYNDFMKKNPDQGFLKVQITTTNGLLPVEGVRVRIYKDIGEYNVLFFDGLSNSSGIIDNIVLPAPKTLSFTSLNVPEYSNYGMILEKEGFNTKMINFTIFSNIKVLQNVLMEKKISIESTSK